MGKSKTKVARKTLQKNIKTGLIKELKESTSQLVKSSKKLDKLIDKSSEKLAKKLSGKLKLNKAAIVKSTEQVSATTEPDNTSGKVAAKQTKSPALTKRPLKPAPAVINPIPKKTTVKKTAIVQQAKIVE